MAKNITNKINSLLNLRGKEKKELAEYLEITSQSLANKLNRGSFSADDLIKISVFLDYELAFSDEKGTKIILDEQDIRK